MSDPFPISAVRSMLFPASTSTLKKSPFAFPSGLSTNQIESSSFGSGVACLVCDEIGVGVSLDCARTPTLNESANKTTRATHGNHRMNDRYIDVTLLNARGSLQMS